MSVKEPADLVIEARWVMPMAPAGGTLSRHAVAVKEGKIAAIGPAVDILARFDPREHIVRADHALLPGFVNAHTHAAMTLLCGFPPRGPLMRWLREVIWPAEQRWLSRDFVRVGTRLAMAEMLRTGITAFGDMYIFPDETARVAADTHMHAVIGLPIAEAPSAWAEDAAAYIAKAEQLWDEYKSDPWVCLQFAPHAPYSVSDATLQRVRRVADELDARVVMHVHETEVEIRDSLATYGLRPLERLDKLGLLRPGFTAVHMNALNETDLATVARTGTSIVACPQSNLRLGSGTTPIGELRSRNVCIGLGTDGSASVGALDILAEARLAGLLSRLPAEEVLRMATLGGAAAIGLSSTLGSLEPGKSADLICVDLKSLATQTQTLPAEAVLYASTRQQIGDVWIAGRRALADGRLLAFDEEELLQLKQEWTGRIHGVSA